MMTPEAPDPTKRIEQPPDVFVLKRIRTLSMVGILAGIVSLFIGGIYLGIAGLVCSIIALRQVLRVAKNNQGTYAKAALQLKRMALIAVIVCAVCIITNAIAVAILMPKVLEALQTSDYASLGLTIPTETITKTWG